MSEEMIVGLGQVRYILRSVANGDDQSDAALKAAQIVESAIELLSAYNPNERLREALEDLPRMIELQRTAAPEHDRDDGWNAGLDRAAAMVREALSPLPQGEDT